jgi:hypothetical protein
MKRYLITVADASCLATLVFIVPAQSTREAKQAVHGYYVSQKWGELNQKSITAKVIPESSTVVYLTKIQTTYVLVPKDRGQTDENGGVPMLEWV